jgi:oleate hydratase
LFDTDKEVHPMYESTHNPKYLLEGLIAISR